MPFREYTTSGGKKVLAGKDAQTNEELVAQAGMDEIVLHTEKVGSPFVNIKGDAYPGDIVDAAIFCASKSKDWRDNKTDVVVLVFTGEDLYKAADMKLGTFGIRKSERIIVKKHDIERLEQEMTK